MGFAVLKRAAPLLAFLLAMLVPRASDASQPVGKAHCLGCHPVHHAEACGCVSCHRGNPSTDRKILAHGGFLSAAYARFTLPGNAATARGRDLMTRSGCRRCHVSGGEGSRLGSDLDAAFGSRPARLQEAIRLPAVYMPDFRFDEEAVHALVNAIYGNGMAGQVSPKNAREIPFKVHFRDRGDRLGSPPFVRYCGGCHRAISRDGVGMGTGAIGPNLSGLFTKYNPGNPDAKNRWTPKTLIRWVANPRGFRPLALMPPLRIEEKALPALVESLQAPLRGPGQAR